MNKRKLIVIVLALLILLPAIVVASLTTFGGQPQLIGPHIAPMQLTADQRNIVDLISHPGQEILLFEYHLSETFDSAEFWVEVYRYGELVETPVAGIGMSGWRGMPFVPRQLAVTIHQTADRQGFQWTFAADGARWFPNEPWVASEPYLGRAFGPMQGPVAIEEGRTIVLYVSRFTTGSTLNAVGDLQWYLENPEALAGYSYVHMILARFSS